MRTTPSGERRRPFADVRATETRRESLAGTPAPEPGAHHSSDRDPRAPQDDTASAPDLGATDRGAPHRGATDRGALDRGGLLPGARWRTITDPPPV